METQLKLPIYVIGDSHTRAFSFNTNFFPLFVGAGKENCFVSDETLRNITANFFKTLDALVSDNPVMLVVGEPDTRFYLGQGWYPWDSKVKENISGFEKKVDGSIDRVETLLDKLKKRYTNKFILFNVTPSQRVNQNKVTDYFNRKLEQLCKKRDCLFVFINDKIYSGDEKIIHEKYYGDTVHLNNKIQPLVEAILKENDLIGKSGFDENVQWSHQEVMKKFSFDEKFGCYKLING